MANDDYPVIVCRILVFLYRRLKGHEDRKPEEYIVADTTDFPVDDEYLRYVLEKMDEGGLIERIVLKRAWGGDLLRIDISEMRITPKGIDYLRTNSTMSKIASTIREAASIASLFV